VLPSSWLEEDPRLTVEKPGAIVHWPGGCVEVSTPGADGDVVPGVVPVAGPEFQ
jgi:hypothetical protein